MEQFLVDRYVAESMADDVFAFLVRKTCFNVAVYIRSMSAPSPFLPWHYFYQRHTTFATLNVTPSQGKLVAIVPRTSIDLRNIKMPTLGVKHGL